MYTVKKKPLTSNTLWDAEKGEPLCKFVKGEFKTNDTNLVEKLKNMGYEVTGESDPDNESAGDGSENNSGEPDKKDTKHNSRSQKTADK